MYQLEIDFIQLDKKVSRCLIHSLTDLSLRSWLLYLLEIDFTITVVEYAISRAISGWILLVITPKVKPDKIPNAKNTAILSCICLYPKI